MIYNRVMKSELKKISCSKSNNIGIINLNIPDKMNVLDNEVFEEINRTIDLFEADDEIRVVVFRSNCTFSKDGNRIFSVGVNLKEYDKKFELIDKDSKAFKLFLEHLRSIISKFENMNTPIIAAVDGIAVGGAFEMILACDLILASSNAKFTMSEVNIGFIPGYGGINRLLKTVGKHKAFEIVATGKLITAREAFSADLVCEVVEQNNFDDRVLEYATRLSEKSPNALKLIKRTINYMTDMNLFTQFEIESFISAVSHWEAKEGVSAFLEKRMPSYK